MHLATFLFRHRRCPSWAAIAIAICAVFAFGITGLKKYFTATERRNSCSTTTLAFMVLQMLGLDASAYPGDLPPLNGTTP